MRYGVIDRERVRLHDGVRGTMMASRFRGSQGSVWLLLCFVPTLTVGGLVRGGACAGVGIARGIESLEWVK